jgi:hypothetical protein
MERRESYGGKGGNIIIFILNLIKVRNSSTPSLWTLWKGGTYVIK